MTVLVLGPVMVVTAVLAAAALLSQVTGWGPTFLKQATVLDFLYGGGSGALVRYATFMVCAVVSGMSYQGLRWAADHEDRLVLATALVLATGFFGWSIYYRVTTQQPSFTPTPMTTWQPCPKGEQLAFYMRSQDRSYFRCLPIGSEGSCGSGRVLVLTRSQHFCENARTIRDQFPSAPGP